MVSGCVDEHITNTLEQPFASDEIPLRPFMRMDTERLTVGVVYRHWIADSSSIQQLMEAWFCRALGRSTRPLTLQLPAGGLWRQVGPGPLGWSVPMEVLRVFRRHIRLRRATKIDGTALDDPRTQYRTVRTPEGLIEPLRRWAARRRVTLNDLFLAALLESCSRHVPRQVRPNRPDLAVGAIAALRRARSHQSFGLSLGFLTAVARPGDLAEFDRLLQVVSRQTRRQKSDGLAGLSLLWSIAGAAAARIKPPSQMYHFYRKVFPLLGGVSNVDLTRTWAANYPDLLLNYQRVSPAGPMVPLVVTTTTLGSRFNIGLTHRTGLIPPQLAEQIGHMFVDRLIQTAGV